MVNVFAELIDARVSIEMIVGNSDNFPGTRILTH
jgi:hypothetical protein